MTRSGWVRRTQMLIDHRMQIAVMLMTITAPIIVAFVYMSAIALLPNDGVLTLTGAEATRLAIKINLVYCLFCAISLAGVAIIFTHRVAGPAMVMERAIEAFGKGDYHPRLKLRKEDYLKKLASALQDHGLRLEQNSTRRRELIDDVTQALADDDLATARELLAEMRTLDPVAVEASAGEPMDDGDAEPVAERAADSTPVEDDEPEPVRADA